MNIHTPFQVNPQSMRPPLTPDVKRVQDANLRIPQLRAPGNMYRIDASPNHLPAGTRLVCQVDMDQIATAVVQNGAALCTAGMATCVMLAAKGADAQGRTVIGLLHQSADFSADDAVRAMRNAMSRSGVAHYGTFVLGGELSRDAAGGGSIGAAIAIADAAQKEGTLTCGRVGVTQMSEEDAGDISPRNNVLPALPNVPPKLCAVVTGQGIYYAGHEDSGPGLFDEDVVPETATDITVVLQEPEAFNPH